MKNTIPFIVQNNLRDEKVKSAPQKTPIVLIITIIVALAIIAVGTYFTFTHFIPYFFNENIFHWVNGTLYYDVTYEHSVEIIIEIASMWLTVIALCIGSTVYGIKSFTKNKLVMTDKRLIVVKRKRDLFSLSFDKLNGVRLKYSLLGKIFNYGRIEISSTTNNTVISKCIKNPNIIASLLKEKVNENIEKEIFSRTTD